MLELNFLRGEHWLSEESNDRAIVLNEDHETFALFLDIIYEYPVDLAYTKECVRLSLLGHKYEASHIIERCRAHLLTSLPSGASERDFWMAETSYEDASMIPSVLRAARLIDMPRIIPWAIYELSVRSETKIRWAADNELIVKPFSNHLKAIQKLKCKIIPRWRKLVARFMKDKCAAEWWVEEDDCWRRTTLEDLENSGFMVEEDTYDPLRDMHEAMEFSCEGLCSICADLWTDYATAFMERFLEEVGLVVCD
ncbi:hypothetical protein RhiTH_002879 [Rhizoctonia solani]|uniref:BTB domain-containing protein n=1 Tax=Rhizoctonia solani TaxID=456999 RepID=A0A8H7HBN0_9AGAM|nr:hypothetical protein RHS04_03168 [Rhizoctonia solani]KAF8759908.1 hypothetical protein RHS01_01652 [Rhizoctonia solani]